MVRFTYLAIALCAAIATPPALAHDFTVGSLKIEHPWARATPKGAPVGGGYFKVTNDGSSPDRLIGGSTGVARNLEIHSMSMEGGMMRMRPVAGGLEIKPGETIELAPGGYHVMFLGLTKPLVQGEKVEATLVFEKAGSVDVVFNIEAIGAPGSGDGHGGHSAPANHMKH